MLVKLLIIFFLYLIIYSLLFSNIYEGMVTTSNNCTQQDISILTYKNAGAIKSMQENISKLEELPSKVSTNSKHIETLADQLTKLMKTQQHAALQLTGSKSSTS